MAAREKNYGNEYKQQRAMRGPGMGPHGMMAGGKAKDFKGTFKKLAQYLKPHGFALIVVLVLTIASTVFSLTTPKILGNATNTLMVGYMSKTAVTMMTEAEDNAQFAAAMTAYGITPLSQCTDNAQKAESFRQIVELLKNMPESDDSPAGNMALAAEYYDEIIQNIAETGGTVDFSELGTIALTLIALYTAAAVCMFIQVFVMVGITQKVVFKMRSDVNAKLIKLPLKYFDSQSHGDILSRVTNDVDTVSRSLQQSLTQIISSVVMIVGILYMMLTISGAMTLITLASLPLSLGITIFITKRSQKYFRGQQKSLGQINGHVEEMYGCHNVVKAYNYEKTAIEEFERSNEELYQNGWKAQFVSGSMMPMVGFIGNIVYVGVCVAGGIIASKGTIMIGSIQAFIQYSRQFNQPISQVAQIVNIMQSTMAAAERVFEVLEQPEQSPDAEDAPKLEQPKGEVRFDSIQFGYDPDKTLIHGISLDVKPGQTIAIVGPTGAGKTTLVNLLMRFYELDGGKITVDGVDIAEMNREELRDLFGMVLQDTWLFNGTIEENIAYGSDHPDHEAIVEAAKAACADHFIRTLPDGYDTIIREDAGNISQGQRQLLTIARAVLKDPAILILDEATSSVDTRTEVLIQEAMHGLMKGRTSFVIAHRLSTIRNADNILVMNHGDIVETGSHEQLMAQNGFYADLYRSQFLGKPEENNIA
ncbi:MAG TPA: ABC transporter ATP-binding protein [Oscillospiraceae bacterium]|nr:ABC transporter ATP-binding protein [Oscillospiraceae bacterium]HPK34499.1 ABC transporter ATP-binding protein [Oscillospiraceae bacterium]HPR74727.1 ABC transporter ATP-binding protein [Oscillospiraceae bacterium]